MGTTVPAFRSAILWFCLNRMCKVSYILCPPLGRRVRDARVYCRLLSSLAHYWPFLHKRWENSKDRGLLHPLQYVITWIEACFKKYVSVHHAQIHNAIENYHRPSSCTAAVGTSGAVLSAYRHILGALIIFFFLMNFLSGVDVSFVRKHFYENYWQLQQTIGSLTSICVLWDWLST